MSCRSTLFFGLLLGLWSVSTLAFTISDTALAPNGDPAVDPEPAADNTPKVLQPAPLFFTRTINGSAPVEEKKPEVVPVIITPFAAKPVVAAPEKIASKTADRLLPLDVIINGAKGGTWLLLERGGNMYAPFDAFTEWRVQLSPEAKLIDYKFDGQEYWPLAAVPGYKVKMDFASQSAELLFSPEAFAATRMVQEQSKRLVLSPVLPSVFLNYDFNFSNTALRNSPTVNDLGVLAEIGYSNAWGVLTSSHAGRNLTDNAAAVAPRSMARLETTFTRDYPNENRTLRLGDSTTRMGMWGRNVYFGGIQFGSNFALTPGFVSQPIPTLTGVSTAPSTVQMYVNDVLRQVSSVPTGPFAIDNFPLLAGSGDVRMVVKDILGRETVIEQSFFTSQNLLAKGLSDWSVEAGKLRRDLGMTSSRYQTYFGGGTWRYGYNNDLTVEGHAEITRATRTAGLGVVSALPNQILGQASLAMSSGSGKSGGLWLIGLDREGLRNTVSLQAQGATQNFRQLGQDTVISPTRLQLAGNWNYSTDDSRSFGMGMATLSRYDNTRVTSISSNFSTRIGEHNSLSFTASRAINGIEGTSIGVFFTMPLGNNRINSASANYHGGKQDFYVSTMQNPNNDSDLGWRALAGHQQGQARVEGGAYYTGRYGKVTSDASLSPNQTALRLGASGGVVFADKNLFATQRVDQSFAITEIAGYSNIGIGLGSNTLTRTNEHGVALIPRLIPYQSNAIRLDPSDLPISAEIDSIEANAIPAWRSAVKVVFPVRGGRAALLKIAFDDGDIAPAGAIVNIEGDKQEFYVARRGEAFITGLSPTNVVLLSWNGQQCKMNVALPPEKSDEIARIDKLLCKGIAR